MANVDFAEIARQVYKKIGYDQDLDIIVKIVKQSPDISQGVDTGGAGDQGIMYGYATDETPEFMPESVVKVHALAKKLEELRKNDPKFSWMGPDGKTQISVRNGKIDSVLVSCQHAEGIDSAQVREQIIEHVITPIIGDMTDIEIFINPTGKFVQGGFEGDTGLTGRKIMVDTYCGLVPHGGGAFSGKDSTKVDRSAAYMARFVAKQMVAGGHAKECLVSVAYAIGKAEPLMVEALNEKGESLAELVKKTFDFRPQTIIKTLGLRSPIFQETAAYGHFGRGDFPWEKV
jgi:S-adenosylmethionine synthetase